MNQKRLIASVMLLLTAFLWGMSYSMQSILSENLGPYAITFVKTSSGFLLLTFALITKRDFKKRTVFAGMLIGVIVAAGLILQQKGLETSTVSKVSFISGLYIVFVPLILLFAKIKPKKIFWLAVLIACVGMYLLTMSNGYGNICIGDFYTLVSAFVFSFQIILIGKYAQDSDIIVFCCSQQVTTAIIAGILMLIFDKPQLSYFTGNLFPIIYLAFGSGLIAQLMQNRFQKDLEPSLASLIMSLESVFGALGGWLLLNQVLTIQELIGCVLIFVAIVMAE